MATKNQEIVQVKLSSGKESCTNVGYQKLVARLKTTSVELFVYEEIQDHTLRVVLEELSLYETH